MPFLLKAALTSDPAVPGDSCHWPNTLLAKEQERAKLRSHTSQLQSLVTSFSLFSLSRDYGRKDPSYSMYQGVRGKTPFHGSPAEQKDAFYSALALFFHSVSFY